MTVVYTMHPRIADSQKFQEIDAEIEKLCDLIRKHRRNAMSDEAEKCFSELLDGIADLRKDSTLTTYANGSDL